MGDSSSPSKHSVREFWMSTDNSSISCTVLGVFGHSNSCSGPDRVPKLDETVGLSSPAFSYV